MIEILEDKLKDLQHEANKANNAAVGLAFVIELLKQNKFNEEQERAILASYSIFK